MRAIAPLGYCYFDVVVVVVVASSSYSGRDDIFVVVVVVVAWAEPAVASDSTWRVLN